MAVLQSPGVRGQKPPTAQWTDTGSGAVILAAEGTGPRITHDTLGRVVDKGITDVGNMGAARAPGAYDTLRAHFADTRRGPSDYDSTVTGDPGSLGQEIAADFFQQDGVDLGEVISGLRRPPLSTPGPRTSTPEAPAAGAAPWC